MKELEVIAKEIQKKGIECMRALDAAVDALTGAIAMTELLARDIQRRSEKPTDSESLYCRKCKKTFTRDQVGEITSLTVPCPECQDPLVPSQNLKKQEQAKDEPAE